MYNMGMLNYFQVTIEDKTYDVHLKRIRTRYIRFYFKEGAFHVTCPLLTRKEIIVQGLNKYYKRLVTDNPHNVGFTDEYIYILGTKVPIKPNGGVINFKDDSKIVYKDIQDLKKKIKKYLLEIITKRTRLYEYKMGTYENKVRVRDMTTRYGSNSVKNRSITYSLILVHYSLDVIDSIVVHELAHCFVHGHDNKFYKIVYKYCPNYDYINKKLKKGIFHD